MWGSTIVVFREVFEIAIILCVILAATKGVQSRGKWINLGILAGIIGAALLGAATQTVSILAGPEGQQYFNAGILLTAVIMIGWTVVWMKRHSFTIVSDLKQVGKAVSEGEKPLHMLAIVTGLAVMREGSEIVIFLYGMLAAGQTTLMGAIIGGIIGLLLGVGFGVLMYNGLIRFSVKYLFQVTSVLLTFIAAGMAANAGGKLVKAGLLPILTPSLWDTSSLLSQRSIIGRFFHILFGYQDNPNGMQGLFYIATILMIFYFIRRGMTASTPKAA
ncbi:MAG TPA: FTR1 family protein [Gammaproteobacteria bacterium]|jgi:high-affinity iron transporter|nr:FTR1 family protein [Gammaproteobacteria bacterium]